MLKKYQIVVNVAARLTFIQTVLSNSREGAETAAANIWEDLSEEIRYLLGTNYYPHSVYIDSSIRKWDVYELPEEVNGNGEEGDNGNSDSEGSTDNGDDNPPDPEGKDPNGRDQTESVNEPFRAG